MKKLLVCALVAALLPACLFALDLSAGVKGGVGIQMFNGQDWKDLLDFFGETNGMKLGLSAAVFLNIGITDTFSIQPEAGYSLLGGKEVDSSADYYARYSMDTLEVPVFFMPKFSIGSGTLVLFAGPDLFFLLGDIKGAEYLSGTKITEGDFPVDNSLLFGIAGGIGYVFPLGSGSLVLDAKYAQVLTKMFDDVKWYTGGLNVRIGYAFKL